MAKKVELKERGTGKIMYPVVIPETMQLDKDVTLADIINGAKEGEALVKTEDGVEFRTPIQEATEEEIEDILSLIK